MAVRPDHVHLLIRLDPGTSVARAAWLLKGASSHHLRRMFSALAKTVSPTSLWADGYFAESVGAVQDIRIRDYIARQAHA